MAVELRCHQFYSPDDYNLDSVEEAVSVARSIFRARKSWPLDILDLDTNDRWLIHITESEDIVLFQQVKP